VLPRAERTPQQVIGTQHRYSLSVLVVTFKNGILPVAVVVAISGWLAAFLFHVGMVRDQTLGDLSQDPFEASRLVGNATWGQRFKKGMVPAMTSWAKFSRVVRNVMLVVGVIATVVFLVTLVVEAL
jgi:hypothetical protein